MDILQYGWPAAMVLVVYGLLEVVKTQLKKRSGDDTTDPSSAELGRRLASLEAELNEIRGQVAEVRTQTVVAREILQRIEQSL